MPLLGVNIDHVATLRQARYRPASGSAAAPVVGEPDVVFAAHQAELGGADIITVHLREDRRHIQDRDLELLARLVPLRLNLEMGATDEMVAIARRLRADSTNAGRPHMCTLVPEGRAEVTTEGGLDVLGQLPRMRDVVRRLKDVPPLPSSSHAPAASAPSSAPSSGAGSSGSMLVSAFIDAAPAQIEAAKDAGFDACEIHTGPYAAAFAHAGGDFSLGTLARERDKVLDAGHRARALGMRFHAGHALNYANVGPIATLPGVTELHIGHALVSRAVFVGLAAAVREMKHAMRG